MKLQWIFFSLMLARLLSSTLAVETNEGLADLHYDDEAGSSNRQSALRGHASSSTTNETMLASSRASSAARRLEIDTLEVSGKVVASVANKIPVVGSGLKLLVDIFWPKAAAVSAWEQIQDRLMELLDNRFRQAKYYERWNTLLTHMSKIGNSDENADSLYETFSTSLALPDYGESTHFLSAAYVMEEMISVMNEAHVEMRFSKTSLEALGESDLYDSELETNMLIIPASVDFALMHLSLLRDRVTMGPHIYADFDGVDGRYWTHWISELEAYAATYEEYFGFIHAKWIPWRKSTLNLYTVKRKDRCISGKANTCNREGRVYCIKDPLAGNHHWIGSQATTPGFTPRLHDKMGCPGNDAPGVFWIDGVGGKKKAKKGHNGWRYVIVCESDGCAKGKGQNDVTRIMNMVEKPRMEGILEPTNGIPDLARNLPEPRKPGSFCLRSDMCDGSCDTETQTCRGALLGEHCSSSDDECDGNLKCNTDFNECHGRATGGYKALCTTHNQCTSNRYPICNAVGGGRGVCLAKAGQSCTADHMCVSKKCVSVFVRVGPTLRNTRWGGSPLPSLVGPRKKGVQKGIGWPCL